jgi:ATP-dependent helicase/nuclease subunit B
LPDHGSHSLYDIKQLLPFIESGYVLLTPNLRLARRIRDEWSRRQIEAGLSSWQPLAVSPLESWLQQRWLDDVEAGHLPPRLKLNAGQVEELWRQSISRSEGSADGLNLLRPDAAAKIAEQARDTLLRWQLDPHLPNYRQLFTLDKDCATFYQWLTRFEARLGTDHLATPADCLRDLLQHGQSEVKYKVVLIEVDDPNPLQKSLLARLCNDLQEVRSGVELAAGELQAYADRRGELQGMAKWAQRLSSEQPDATIGLVLPNMDADRNALEYLLRREFNCLGAGYSSLPVNFSTSITLARAPVIRDAMTALEFGLERVSVDRVLALLRSRFISLAGVDSSDSSRFAAKLQDWGQTEVSVDEVRNLANSVSSKSGQGVESLSLARNLMTLAAMRELRGKHMPSQWSTLITQMLDVWSWPGERGLDSLEYQQVEIWFSVLEQFGQYDVACGELSLGAALVLLRRICEQQAAQPQTKDSNIQVLGTLEAAGLNFDYLWICSMQATSWPAAAQPNPLVPLQLQRQFDMPHSSAEREWRYAENLILSYRRATAKGLIASYATHLDGVPELPSALLEDFSLPSGEPQSYDLDAAWTACYEQRDIELLESQTAPPVSEQELSNIRGGSSLLENQSQCPFRAFARHRLSVVAPGGAVAALSPAERGSVLHEALYLFWGQVQGSAGLEALTPDDESVLCDAVAGTALEKLPEVRRRTVGAACLALEKQRLVSLLQEWLAVERERQGEFRVTAREEDHSVNFGPLTVRLQVDRIDTLADGGKVIIDYKSARSKIADWLGERPEKPQLLLYSLAAAETPVALAFAQVRSRDCRYVGLGDAPFAPGIATDITKAVRGRLPATDWHQLNTHWQQQLQELAEAFLAGRASVDPINANSCTWCGLQSLCRVGLLPEDVT